MNELENDIMIEYMLLSIIISFSPYIIQSLIKYYARFIRPTIQ